MNAGNNDYQQSEVQSSSRYFYSVFFFFLSCGWSLNLCLKKISYQELEVVVQINQPVMYPKTCIFMWSFVSKHAYWYGDSSSSKCKTIQTVHSVLTEEEEAPIVTPRLLQLRRTMPELQRAEEVLARFTDDGWYYRGNDSCLSVGEVIYISHSVNQSLCHY